MVGTYLGEGRPHEVEDDFLASYILAAFIQGLSGGPSKTRATSEGPR